TFPINSMGKNIKNAINLVNFRTFLWNRESKKRISRRLPGLIRTGPLPPPDTQLLINYYSTYNIHAVINSSLFLVEL
ncbi:MAG: hypothetical protein AB3K77_12350, partial [Methanosarcinaceae archaeon]